VSAAGRRSEPALSADRRAASDADRPGAAQAHQAGHSGHPHSGVVYSRPAPPAVLAQPSEALPVGDDAGTRARHGTEDRLSAVPSAVGHRSQEKEASESVRGDYRSRSETTGRAESGRTRTG